MYFQIACFLSGYLHSTPLNADVVASITHRLCAPHLRRGLTVKSFSPDFEPTKIKPFVLEILWPVGVPSIAHCQPMLNSVISVSRINCSMVPPVYLPIP